MRRPVTNGQGVPHLYADGLPGAEGSELQSLVHGMQGKNTDHQASPVFNPAVSSKQRKMMAIAEHHPEKLYARNRGALSMKKSQLHDFAATKGLGRKK